MPEIIPSDKCRLCGKQIESNRVPGYLCRSCEKSAYLTDMQATIDDLLEPAGLKDEIRELKKIMKKIREID